MILTASLLLIGITKTIYYYSVFANFYTITIICRGIPCKSESIKNFDKKIIQQGLLLLFN